MGLSGKKVLFWVWIILVAMVAISRMYLGVHSLDQVMFGLLTGACFLTCYRLWLQ